ncbi:MAG: RloB domain-containing protein [Bacteroidales bacterium]|nr:RloB domain-containing protein [Bacteroidales bacterium]
MMERELAEEVKQPKYFESQIGKSSNEGTKEIAPLLPFVISGGKNTEYYYFKHINTIKGRIFNITPEYFGKESNYTKEFPRRINNILQEHGIAKIFCVFDYDTIYNNPTNQQKHKDFENEIKSNLDAGYVVLCPSMPSIEYWFLLHFENYTDLITSCGNKMNGLLTVYMQSYFPNSNKKIIDTLTSEKYVKESQWVEKLCSGGKLEFATERAEENTQNTEGKSFSYVYKVFKKENC